MVDNNIRSEAPKFPSMIKYSTAENVFLIDFFNLKFYSEDKEEYESFSSIVLTKRMAEDMLKNLVGFLTKDDDEYKIENLLPFLKQKKED